MNYEITFTILKSNEEKMFTDIMPAKDWIKKLDFSKTDTVRTEILIRTQNIDVYRDWKVNSFKEFGEKTDEFIWMWIFAGKKILN